MYFYVSKDKVCLDCIMQGYMHAWIKRIQSYVQYMFVMLYFYTLTTFSVESCSNGHPFHIVSWCYAFMQKKQKSEKIKFKPTFLYSAAVSAERMRIPAM